MINYSFFFLLSSFFYHLHRLREHFFCNKKIEQEDSETKCIKSSDVWGAIRDCALPLILLPFGTNATKTYFSMVCCIAIGGCGRDDVKDTKPVTCLFLGIRFADFACKKQSAILGLCAAMFVGVGATSFWESKHRIMAAWLYPAVAVVPFVASRMGG